MMDTPSADARTRIHVCIHTYTHTRKPPCRYRLDSSAKGCTPAECCEHAITIKLERVEKLACTQLPGVCARIIRHVGDLQPSSRDHKQGLQHRDSGHKHGGNDAMSGQHVLLNTLHARCESPVSSITRTLARAEHASHLLVWGMRTTVADHDATAACTATNSEMETDGLGGDLRMACVDMVRLDAKFVVKNMSKAAGKSTPALFSEVTLCDDFFWFALVRARVPCSCFLSL